MAARTVGPLIVSPRNPRYFSPSSGDGAGRAVYLTGSHIWNNLHDGMGPGPDGPAEPEPFDYEEYLRFLTERGHNFIRLWRWEQFRSQAAGGRRPPEHGAAAVAAHRPWPCPRDDRPRFDLDQFDPAFFERLRVRVAMAGDSRDLR